MCNVECILKYLMFKTILMMYPINRMNCTYEHADFLKIFNNNVYFSSSANF